MGRTLRISSPAIALVALLCWAAIGLAAPGPGLRVGVPHSGAPGRAESVADVMARQAAADVHGRRMHDVEEEIEQPDRSHLPQNPASPVVSGISHLPPGIGARHDAKTQGTQAIESPQVVGTNFTGATLSGTNPTLSFPPDCMGAVGPSQYVVFVNGRLVTFNKATGVADGALNADPDVFFASVLNGSSTSDPRIRYDRLSGRWILVIINVSTPNRILLAVSDAASAGTITGSTVFTYFFINIATTPPTISNTCLADYPTLGVDANALYIGTNNFCGAITQTFNSCDGYVIRKSSILGAGPIVLTVFRGIVANSSAVGPYTPQGVDNYDPASNEGFFIGVDNATFGTLMMRRVGTPGGTPTISSNISITIPATSFPITVNHLGNSGGTNGRLDALDDRLFAAHIRGGRLWTAHNIGVNNTGAASGTLTRDGSRWYELIVPAGSGTPTIAQSGTVFTATGTNSTDQRSYFIPSIMVTGQGHAALGFTTAGTNERANAATVGRLSGDGGSTMETPVLYTTSSTAYNPASDPGGSGGRRWGDYSYTSLDPLDDQTLWTVQQFCDATNSYGVRVAKLLAPPPATPSAAPDVTAGQNPATVTLTGVSSSGSGFWDPGSNLPGVPAFSHLSAVVTNGGATGTPPAVVSATYLSPTSVSLVLNAAGATANVAAEKYTVTVTNPDGQSSGAAVIHVVSGAPVATIAAGPTVAEGNAATTACNFTVNLTAAATSAVTVNYQTGNGSATTADNDYVAATSFITIPIGQSSGTITVTGNGDTKFEPDETFTVTLTGATNANLGATVVSTGTIQNDDTQPVITIGDPSAAAEGNAATTAFNFPVTLSNTSASIVSVHYESADGSATIADNDYAAASGTLNIPAGQLSGNVAVNATGDTKFEGNETFAVTLSLPVNGTLGATTSGTATINNDDTAPVMSINNVTLAEGNAGTTVFGFTASLSAASGLPASAGYQTSDGSATLSDLDYQSASGTVSFPAGSTTQPVSVTVNGDIVRESHETFLVTLSSLSGAQSGTLVGTGTIANDDSVPVVSIDSVAAPEGDAGTSPLTFTVHLSNPSDQQVSAHYQTGDLSASVSNGDYLAASGTVIVPAGSLSAPLAISMVGDSCHEADEDILLTLSVPVGASLGPHFGRGVILNDDNGVPPTVAVVAPNGGELVTPGDTLHIQWTATDDGAVSAVDLALSRDNGATFPEALATGIANTGAYDWIVTGPTAATPTARVRVTAHDNACNSSSDSSDAAFHISAPITAAPAEPATTDFALGRVRPNPTSGASDVDFQLPRAASIRLSVLDVQGREVSVLVEGSQQAGRHTARWNGRTARGPAATGVYFVRYLAGGRTFTRRLVLAR